MDLLISVVIPTYNHANFLKRALQSVVDQSYPHWEAVVIDNHSQDNTDEVVKSFHDPRIRLLKIHNHGVIAASRNLGIREAKGEWVAFLDSDDYWYPQKMITFVQEVSIENDVDVFCSNELMVNVQTGAKKILRHGPYEKNFYQKLLLEGNRLSPTATIIRAQFLQQHQLLFNESPAYITVEDYALWLDLARCHARFKFIDKIHSEYTIHGSNSSGQFIRHLKNCENLLFDQVHQVQKFDSSPKRLWKYIYPRFQLAKARQQFIEGHVKNALHLLMQTLLSSPQGTLYVLWIKLKKNFNNRALT